MKTFDGTMAASYPPDHDDQLASSLARIRQHERFERRGMSLIGETQALRHTVLNVGFQQDQDVRAHCLYGPILSHCRRKPTERCPTTKVVVHIVNSRVPFVPGEGSADVSDRYV